MSVFLVAPVLSIPAIPEFPVIDFFKADRAAEVPIGLIGDRFTEQFGDQIEPPVPEATLRVRTLGSNVSGDEIIAEISQDKAIVSLGQAYQAMKELQKGETQVYIFFVRSLRTGELWALFCHWYSAYRYLHVGADPLSYVWSAGYQVVSP